MAYAGSAVRQDYLLAMPLEVFLSREYEEVVHVSGLKKVKQKHQIATNATRL